MQAMYRLYCIGLSAATALGVALFPGGAAAESKSLKEQLAGVWTLLLVDGVTADGTHLPGYGPNPIGTVIFSPDGHYSLQIMRAVRPKFASDNPAQGTADENKAAVQGMISHFGSYTANDADKTFALRIEGSSFPNQDGTRQSEHVTAITDDLLTYTDTTPTTAPSGSATAELAWRRAK
jgi:Lipocalin-like domain